MQNYCKIRWITSCTFDFDQVAFFKYEFFLSIRPSNFTDLYVFNVNGSNCMEINWFPFIIGSLNVAFEIQDHELIVFEPPKFE